MDRLDSLPRRELPGGLVVATAVGPLSRLRGLAGLARLAPRTGLHLPGCRSVHTVGMRFALDLVWLDARGLPVRVDRGVGPCRMRGCRQARSVLEVGAGRADSFVSALSMRTASSGVAPATTAECLRRS